MNPLNLFRRRRRYTKQPARCYWPRSPWDNEMGGYTNAGDELPGRCYVVRGLSIHTPSGREWLRSHKALMPQPGFNGPPLAREVHPSGSHPLIPPAAMTLIALAHGPAWFDTLDQFVWWVDARRQAKLLLRMFSLRDPLAWGFLIWRLLHPKYRPNMLRALGLMKWVDETYTAKQAASNSVPSNGAGIFASTV